ncbi:MAG TPA: hypothetical protein VF896_04760 [Anaerolineales bacterium]
MDSIDATGGILNSTDMTNGAKRYFARRESVYDYLRPRRTSLQHVCKFASASYATGIAARHLRDGGLSAGITCWQNESLPSN